MEPSFIRSSLRFPLTIIPLLLLMLLPRCASIDERFADCAPFNCGNLTNVSYPFSGNGQPDYCGYPGFQVDCTEGNLTLDIMSVKYQVFGINPKIQILTIARLDLSESNCPSQYFNTTWNNTLFDYTSNYELAALLYNCSSSSEPFQPPTEFLCPVNDVNRPAYFLPSMVATSENLTDLYSCSISIVIPVLKTAFDKESNVSQAIKQGFEVRWTIDQVQCTDCVSSGGRCGYNGTIDQFTCFCPDQAYESTCPSSPPPSAGKDSNLGQKIGIAAGAGALGMAMTCMVAFIISRRKKMKKHVSSSSLVSRSTTSCPSSKSDVEKGGYQFGVYLFTYVELEEATNNFNYANELGEGGFGTVYYGKLQDGRAVAVKRLYENNYKRVEQFMNEVDILTRLRHPNLVLLYGCTSRHSRELLLVYEYISNGTVADHLHGEKAKPGALAWPTRMNIAIETASALAYLHASDIIHRDVKTNNILLDNNFIVKVADFGLSRLFPTDVTHISTAPQGTPGYVDPEYHQCYQLTDKSDVYSFGVVLIELISSLPAVDITRHRHEINLSNMAINKIQSHALHELVDQSLGYESYYATRRMINAVAELAFQCLQCEKDLRPSMDKVLEVLKAIQSGDYNLQKAEEMDVSADDVVLLKSGPLPLSPDSVTAKWDSL